MAAPKLAVKITAVDNTAAAIDAVAKRLAGITAPATKIAKSMARLSDASGVTRLSKAIVHLGGAAIRTGDHLISALAPFGALTAALSVGGFAKMTSDWARFSQSLSFDARRIGAGVSQLHALEGSAQLSGSSAEAAASGLRNLQDVMTDTVGGRNMEALVYFRQLGVAFDDGAGHALRATAVLPKLSDAIARIKDPSLQARVATQFFGGAAEELLPWLRRGSVGMAEYAEMARHYGVETEDSTDKAGVFRLAQTRLALAFKGLGNAISEKVSPPLSKMMTFLAELVARNRGLISDKFGAWAKQFGDWVSAIDWAKTAKYFGDLFDRFERWTDAMSKFTVPAWMKKMFGLGGDDSANVEVTPDGKIAMPRPGGVDYTNSPPLTPGQHTDLGKAIMGMFEGAGQSHDDAAAILSGLDRESGLRDDALGDRDKVTGEYKAYGVAQWHPDRQAQFNAWSKAGGTADGHDIRHSTLEDQIKFIQWDVTQGKYKSVGDHMRAAKTRDEKVAIFDREYEAPADTEGAIRSDIARADQWAKQSATQPGAPGPVAAQQPSWIDKLDDGPFKRLLQGRGGDAPASTPPAAAAAPSGAVKVDVNIKGLPPGATATTTTSGAAQGSVLVYRAMP